MPSSEMPDGAIIHGSTLARAFRQLHSDVGEVGGQENKRKDRLGSEKQIYRNVFNSITAVAG